MNYLIELVNHIYAYCTDFVINLANILNLSYYEINFIIFVVLYPVMIVGSIVIYVIQRLRLKRIKEHNNVYKKIA
tara:strand:+ start:583 stop:807 length:225 start_codon:yes stop_codon:yes gene_type:complete